MSTPEDALDRARVEAEALRAAEPDATARARPPEEAWQVSTAKLMEWAAIEPDLAEVRSTRPHGAPITALKRALVRLLVQYNGQLAAQQTRFNVNLLARVRRLEDRLDELERERGS